MAIAGMRPVVEIQFLGFAYPAFDQIVSHVGRIRNRSNHRFTAPMVMRIPYGGGIGAAEHHSESSEAIFAHTPGIKVVVPSNPYDAKGMLLSAIADPDPVVFLEPIRLYRAVKQEVPDGEFAVPLGKAATVREGSDVTVVSYGAMVRVSNRAADLLEVEGVSAEVIDLRSLTPLDEDAIVAAARRTGRVVVVTESHRTAGMASEVAAVVQERALYSLLAPVERVTGWDTIVPLKRTEGHYVPGPERIASAIRRVVAT
jgi:pyruvate dehydrogenase E1 component beta subunit